MPRRRLLLVALGLAAACAHPTLPLPPPSSPEVTRVGEGRYRLRGVVLEPGIVFALNLRTRQVAGEETQGRYDFEVSAAPGDPMRLWYTSGTEMSDTRDFEIPEDPPDAGAGDAPGDSPPG